MATRLGALCVIDYQPRQITPDQINALRVLSQQVMAQMELGWQKQQLKEINDGLEQRIKDRTTSLSASLHRLLKVQSALLKREAASRHNALHDPLTGLPNRSYFLQRLGSVYSASPAQCRPSVCGSIYRS